MIKRLSYLLLAFLIFIGVCLFFDLNSFNNIKNNTLSNLGGGTSDLKPIRNFLGLTDTPDSYSGQAGKCTAVNGSTNALEFVTCGTGGGGSLPQNLWATSSPSFAGLTISSNTGIAYLTSGAVGVTSTISYASITSVPSFLTTTTWGGIGGTLSNQTDLQSALNAKQASLGFTAENVANKSTDTALGTSDTLYPSQNAVKSYVDNAFAGISPRTSCKVASTVNLNTTYLAGVLTNAGALAALQIDGVNLAVSDRVLVKNQTTVANNGIYTVTTIGSGAIAWVLTRATDYDSSAEVFEGTYTLVEEGTVNAETLWVMQTAGTITIGATDIVFAELLVASQAHNNLTSIQGGTTNEYYHLTSAQNTIVGNTSGTNTGDETTSSIGTLISGSQASTTPGDTDLFAMSVGNLLKKITWANIKATLKTYFDTLYASISTTITAGIGLSGGGDLSTNRTLTLNMAGGTCSGTDKISALSATGTIVCSADSTGGGTGTPQDLYATSSPTFAGLTLTGASGYGKYTTGVFSSTTTIPWSDVVNTPTILSATSSIDHNTLANLDSGSTYLHLTTLQKATSTTQASGSQNGWLAKGDWTTFNSKLSTTTWGGIGGTLANQLDLQSALNAKLSLIATSSIDHNSVSGLQGGQSGQYYHLTSAQNTVVGNTSGTNTGNETATSVATIITGSSATTSIADAFEFPLYDTVAGVLRKITWTNIKASLKTYFDTLYASISTTITAGTGLSGGGDLSTSRTLTLNMAGGTCSGTDKISALSATGTITCTADSTGGGTAVMPQDLYATSSPEFAGLTLTGFSGYLKATTGVFGTTSSIPWGDVSGEPTFLTTESDPIWTAASSSYALLTSTVASSTQAGYLAVNGSNCSAGSFPLGVDQYGNSESCTAAITLSSFSATAPLSYNSGTGAFSLATSSLNHANLFNLQGGTTNEYYHLTSAQNTVVGNTSGTNTGDNATNSQYSSDYRAANFIAGTHYLATTTGNWLGTWQGYSPSTFSAETTSTIGTLINGSPATTTPGDTDLVAMGIGSVLKKLTWANLKVTLLAYFDTLYQRTANAITLAFNLVTNGKNIEWTVPSPGTATSTGDITTMTVADNAYGLGALMYVKTDGQLSLSNGSTTSTVPALFMATETGTGSKKVMMRGLFSNSSWNFTGNVGKPVYISTSTAGMPTTTLPMGIGQQIQVVGHTIGTSTIYFLPDLTQIEL